MLKWLTDKKEADVQRLHYENRLKEERFLKLAAYEDTGLEPEEIATLTFREEVLAGLLTNVTCCHAVSYERLEALAEAEKEGRLAVLPPNDPLTLDELREMDGEPVWIQSFVVGLNSHWGIVHGNYISDGKLPNERGKCLLLIDDTGGYDIAWLAYRRKPEVAP